MYNVLSYESWIEYIDVKKPLYIYGFTCRSDHSVPILGQPTFYFLNRRRGKHFPSKFDLYWLIKDTESGSFFNVKTTVDKNPNRKKLTSYSKDLAFSVYVHVPGHVSICPYDFLYDPRRKDKLVAHFIECLNSQIKYVESGTRETEVFLLGESTDFIVRNTSRQEIPRISNLNNFVIQ